MKELTKGQNTRVLEAAVKWKRQGLDARNILRHLHKRLGKFKVDWLRIAQRLDVERR